MSEQKTPLTAVLRLTGHRRGAVVTAGVCAALVTGVGGAAVASGAPQDVFASGAADKLADATHDQAEAQRKRAEKEEVAKKAAEERKEASEKKASRSGARGWSLPVNKPYTLTASFGNSGSRWSSDHSGQDFAVQSGTPVKAVNKGRIVHTGWGGAYGNEIVVKHPNGKYSQYAHLSKINVSPGQWVKLGAPIARSGDTGNTSGPHLHFEMRTTPVYGSGFDPAQYLEKHGATP